jgi:hypothetical protein
VEGNDPHTHQAKKDEQAISKGMPDRQGGRILSQAKHQAESQTQDEKRIDLSQGS